MTRPQLRALAGLVSAVIPAAVGAQATAPAASARSSTDDASAQTRSTQETAPPGGEFTGPDGKPLSPERQRELREQLAHDPLPVRPETPADAPSSSPTTAPLAADGDIVVSGQRPRGSVIGDIPPTLTFSPLDIKAYGANDIGELLQTLAPQVSSDRGRDDSGPVVLLNGKRVSSFLEIAKIPTEAIERMEVFPEELALKYGYRADQKVVNIVTYNRFSSRIGQLSDTLPTAGGRDTIGASGNYLRIAGATRFTLDADYNRSGSLLESERRVLQVAGMRDEGRFRTLLPATRQFDVNATVGGDVLNGVSSTLNARYEASSSRSLLGRGADGALARRFDTHVGHLGIALGGSVSSWLWSWTGNYDRTSSVTLTDSDSPDRTRDEARSVNTLADADLVLSGSLARLPAGPISSTLRIGGAIRDFKSTSRLGRTEQRTNLSRDREAIQVNVDLPIASRRAKIWPGLGDLSANVNLAVEQLSDFGSLVTTGYGLTWSPFTQLNLIASATNEEGAPTVEQLGAPLVVTPNVRTFDFIQGEVVDVTRVFGGNPALRSDRRHIIKFGMNTRPASKTDLSFSIDYVRTRIDDPIAPFPIATPEIEAAFPDRFGRDADGRLSRIDGTPLNFDRSEKDQLRWGVNFTHPLGAVPPGMQSGNARFVGSEADLQKSLPPGARIIKPEPGSPAARRFENVSSRLTVSLYYTLNLLDRIRVRDAGPVLDLLNGSATGARGGSPRHEVEFQVGAYKRGLGGRLTAKRVSGTSVNGAAAISTVNVGDLEFSSYTLVNFTLFANLADRFGGSGAPGWLKGTRVSVGVTNLFDARIDVRDAAGRTPISYQPAYLDPLGRSANISLRKIF